MRLGILEIVIIIAVIIAAAFIARILRTGRNTDHQNGESPTDILVKQVEKSTNKTFGFLRRAGIALVLTGVIILLAGIAMFRWAFQSYYWSFIIVVIGIVLVFLSRKK